MSASPPPSAIQLTSKSVCAVCRVHADVASDSNDSENWPRQPLCEGCKDTVRQVRQFAQEESLSWGQMSPRGRKWVEEGRSAQLQQAAAASFSSYQQKEPPASDCDMIEKDVLNGRTDPEALDLSLHSLLTDIDILQFRETIATVLRAYCVRNPQIGYCQGLNNVTMWLLLFMDPENAFWTLCNLVERILTPGFYVGGKTGNSLNGFYIESTVIAALLDYLLPAVRESQLPITDFADCFSLQLLIQLFTLSLDFQSIVFIWDLLFSEGSIALIRGVVALAFICEEEIRSGKHPSIIYQEITHMNLYSQLQEHYPAVSNKVTKIRVERLRRQARDFRAYQWLKDKDLTIKRLEYVSKFTHSEIVTFQGEFAEALRRKRDIEDQARVKIRNAARKGTVNVPELISQGLANVEGNIDIGLTRPEFYSLLLNLHSKLISHFDQLFDIFDEDQSGYLDFREILVCLSALLKGSSTERIHLLFTVFDQDRTGSILKGQFQRLTDALLLPYCESLEQNYDKALKQRVDAVYLSLSLLLAQDAVSWSEFTATVERERELQVCVKEYVEVSGKLEGVLRGVVPERTIHDIASPTASCAQCSIM